MKCFFLFLMVFSFRSLANPMVGVEFIVTPAEAGQEVMDPFREFMRSLLEALPPNNISDNFIRLEQPAARNGQIDFREMSGCADKDIVFRYRNYVKNNTETNHMYVECTGQDSWGFILKRPVGSLPIENFLEFLSMSWAGEALAETPEYEIFHERSGYVLRRKPIGSLDTFKVIFRESRIMGYIQFDRQIKSGLVYYRMRHAPYGRPAVELALAQDESSSQEGSIPQRRYFDLILNQSVDDRIDFENLYLETSLVLELLIPARLF